MFVNVLLLMFWIVFGCKLIRSLLWHSVKARNDLIGISYERTVYLVVGMCLVCACFSNRVLIVIPLFITFYEKKLNSVYRKTRATLQFSFTIWIQSILAFIQTNTLLHALKLSLETVPRNLEHDVEILIKKIEENPEDREAFVGFMVRASTPEIRQTMKYLYRYCVESTVDATRQLQRIIEINNGRLRQQRLLAYSENVEMYTPLGLVPLISVGCLFLVLMTQVIVGLMERGWGI